MYMRSACAGEIEVVVEDDSPEAVFAEALVALGDVLADRVRDGAEVTHEVSVRASDPEALLKAWVDEFVRLAETDGFIPQRIGRIELGPESVSATIGGECGVPQSLIRPATCDRLELERTDGVWRAEIVLEV